MVKRMGNTRRKRFLIIGLFVLAMGVIAYFAINTLRTSGTDPLLHIATRNSGTMIFGGNEVCYEIYANGVAKKTDSFSLVEVEAYRVDEWNKDSSGVLIDSKSGEIVNDSSAVYEIINEIISLVNSDEKLETTDIYKLYVLDNQYFFNVFDDSGNILWSYSDIVFEFLPEENRIVKIVTFRGKTIEHMQMYR